MENMVSIDHLKKIDIRVGKVIEVNDHPNADRLYILKVDFGDFQRQIVTGLKSYYKPEELLGKYIIVIINLEPKMFRGVESQGMLLAAEDKEGNLALLIPDPSKKINVGAKVYWSFFL